MTEDVNVVSQARRTAIVAALHEGVQRVDDLAHRCGVSPMTIRRDLQALEEQNKIRRVRGGAIPVEAWSFEHRLGRTLAAKQAIAMKLLQLAPTAGGIGMDGSTTVHQLALALRDRDQPDITVVTPGLETFHQLTRTPGVRVYTTGGTADPHTGSLVGPLAALTARQFALHTFFASATYVDSAMGSTEFTADEAAVKQAMAGVARRTVLAVDSTKLDKHAVSKCFALSEIDFLVTELPPQSPALEAYVDQVEIL